MRTLIVVSSYPEEGSTHGKETVGVASYTKNTLLSLSKFAKKRIKINVFAEKLKGQRKKYQERNIFINRCWQRNSYLACWQIFKEVTKLRNKEILFEFEAAMLGNFTKNFFFPFLLLALKLLKKEVFLVFHQVTFSLDETGKNRRVMQFIIKTFFKLNAKFCDKVIVFEEYLKQRLSLVIPEEKIVIIPHGIEESNRTFGKQKVRSELGFKKDDFIIIIFGFLAHYKGSDWIIEKIGSFCRENNDKKLKLIVAGGPNPNHLKERDYQFFLKEIYSLVKKYKRNIIFTGYVKERDIGKFYSVADLIIFPYRTSISSSGPLAFAFAYRKPFLVSKGLSEIFKTKDITDSFKELKINGEDIIFSFTENNLFKKLFFLKKNKKLQKKLSLFGREVTEQRSWDKVAKMYYQLIFDAENEENN